MVYIISLKFQGRGLLSTSNTNSSNNKRYSNSSISNKNNNHTSLRQESLNTSMLAI